MKRLLEPLEAWLDTLNERQFLASAFAVALGIFAVIVVVMALRG